MTDRLATGDFQVAVVDYDRAGSGPLPAARLEPDPDRWLERLGLQDPALDNLLVKARAPGTTDERKAAYSALQKQLATGRYLLPLAFADEVVVARDTVEGPVLRQVTDPVGPILGCANMAPRRRPVTVDGVRAEVAELADALVSGTSARKVVWVQVPPSVPFPSDLHPR